MTDPALAAAWDAVHDATPEGWYVGGPYFDEARCLRELGAGRWPR